MIENEYARLEYHYNEARRLRAEATKGALRSFGGWLAGRTKR